MRAKWRGVEKCSTRRSSAEFSSNDKDVAYLAHSQCVVASPSLGSSSEFFYRISTAVCGLCVLL